MHSLSRGHDIDSQPCTGNIQSLTDVQMCKLDRYENIQTPSFIHAHTKTMHPTKEYYVAFLVLFPSIYNDNNNDTAHKSDNISHTVTHSITHTTNSNSCSHALFSDVDSESTSKSLPDSLNRDFLICQHMQCVASFFFTKLNKINCRCFAMTIWTTRGQCKLLEKKTVALKPLKSI